MSFKNLTPEQHREICKRGGKAAHACGKAHRFTTEEAKAAGRKGGLKTAQNRGRRGDHPSPDDTQPIVLTDEQLADLMNSDPRDESHV